MLIRSLTVTAFAILVCASARGQASYDNASTNPIFAYSNGTQVGQSFLTGADPLVLSDVVFPQVTGQAGGGSAMFSDGYTAGETFSLYLNGSVTGTDGQAHNGPGTLVATAIFTLSHNFSLSTGAAGDTGGFTTATAVAPIALLGSTRYWLVLGSPNGVSQVNWNYVENDSSYAYTSTSTGGVGLPDTDTSYELNNPQNPPGTGYKFYNDADGPQAVIINAVPEPSSLCLLGLAGAGAFVMVRRARGAAKAA